MKVTVSNLTPPAFVSAYESNLKSVTSLNLLSVIHEAQTDNKFIGIAQEEIMQNKVNQIEKND